MHGGGSRWYSPEAVREALGRGGLRGRSGIGHRELGCPGPTHSIGRREIGLRGLALPGRSLERRASPCRAHSIDMAAFATVGCQADRAPNSLAGSEGAGSAGLMDSPWSSLPRPCLETGLSDRDGRGGGGARRLVRSHGGACGSTIEEPGIRMRAAMATRLGGLVDGTRYRNAAVAVEIR